MARVRAQSVYVGLWPICLVVCIEADSGKYDDFTNWDSLARFCEESGLKWARASYLQQLHGQAKTMPKEQDIPPEHFIALPDYKRAIGEIGRDRASDDKCPLVISHPWWDPDHPDPERQHLGWASFARE